VQWLDEPSLRALIFAVRRCRAPYALVVTLRDGYDSPFAGLAGAGEDGSALRLQGLALAPLHELLGRSGQVFDRPTMQRLLAVSHGNPLFARELARSLTGDGTAGSPLPSHLSTAMRSRYLGLPGPTRIALLMCSALADPTAATLQRAGVDDAAGALADAEAHGIVTWRGDRAGFSHPMWREVIYRAAGPHERRTVHSRLSEAVPDVEERARHLALSSPLLAPATLAALEDAAASARLRGAPSQAAELLELALDRGAAEPALRLQAALDHFASGANERAKELARRILDEDGARPARAAALSLLGGITYLADDFPQAASYLEQAYEEAGDDPLTRAGAAIDLAFAHANLGMIREGLGWIARAEENAAVAGEAGVAAEAAGAAALLIFLSGGGVDCRRLDAALAHEDPNRHSPPLRWPSMSAALILLWTGDLARARPALTAVRQRYAERGLDIGLSLVLACLAEAAILDGDLTAAASLVSEIAERSGIAGGEAESVMARAGQVALAAYRGDLAGATGEYRELLTVTGGAYNLMGLAAMAALGMCHLSADEPDAAVALLEPVADIVLATGVGEPVVGPFYADAVEALAAAGHADRAVPLVEMLEAWGRRSGSQWSTGAGARGRALLLLAEGNLDAAQDALHRALAAFDVRPHRYERARTILLLAALHRRRRQRTQAQDALILARDQFASLGAAGWQARAERELERLGLQRSDSRELTPSEHRIATLAASGLTNTAVATRLSLSPKTVEAHLTRIYHKLGIHSRAELGQWVAQRPHG
jgi:DNA-binding CsgD family transcriptional regulator